MGLWTKLIGSVTGTIAEGHIIPRVETAVSSIYDNTVVDKRLADEIREEILDKHGQELFYCDLDSYITYNNLIENLINTIRGKSNILPHNQVEFATTNTKCFINQHKKYKTKGIQQKQVYDIFAWMFDFAFSRTNSINPHTENGKLQNELRRIDSGIKFREDKNFATIENMLIQSAACNTEILSKLNEMCSTDDLQCCPPEFEAFSEDIKSIESECQMQDQFEDAISKYYGLLQSISGLITVQNKKYADTLICTLNCNIALCQANLADCNKAFRSLEAIPRAAAEDSKTYHFVYASVLIQHSDSSKYLDAQAHLNRALELDPLYHRAFLLRQYLYAIMGTKDCVTNIEDLNSHFSKVLSENSDLKLVSDFHMNRGVLYLIYDDPYAAYDDFYKAMEFGSDGVVSKLNLSASLYAQAVLSLPKDERFFHPKVDYTKIYAVLTQLKPIIANENIHTQKYKLVAKKAIELYVSACSIVGVQHGLCPVSKYLGLTQDYETQRALILGCQEDLSDSTLSILEETDRVFFDCREMLKKNEIDKCIRKLEALYSISPARVSAPLFHILLQLYIATNNSEAYWEYRTSANLAGVGGEILVTMDACVFELDGNLEHAKALFDSVASTSVDYQLLDNALRFYKRNMFNSDCSALYLRIQDLHEKKEILVEDLDEFYSGAISFLISINSPISVELLQRIDPKEVSPSSYTRMQAFIYSKTNDINHLSTCFSKMYSDTHDFQDGFNLALCQKWLMCYDCALQTCFELLKGSIESNKLAKLYWLVSDLYLLKEDYDESYNWAQKVHELMIENPYDQSHQALFGRALRCGHHEGFAKILEYKETHPVVLNWIQAFSIKDDENPAESLAKQLMQFSPDTANYNKQEKYIASEYRKHTIPNNLLLEFYHNDLWKFFDFAEKNKLRIAMGNCNQLKAEEESIDHHIVVDAQTLIILAYYECLPALQSIEHIHINYGSLNTLQFYYLSADYPYVRNLLRWIETAENIVFHQDGFIEEDNVITKALSRDFVASWVTSRDNNIPLLYSEAIAPTCTVIPEQGIFYNIKFVSIPALCNYYGQNQSRSRDQMLYRLLTGCTFVSFSASTIIEHISVSNYTVSHESMRPFLICKSDYDMKSFADVYLQAISGLYAQNSASAIKLSEIIIDDVFRVWRHGTTYRVMAEKYNIAEDRSRALAISRYVIQVATTIKRIVPILPDDYINKCEMLETIVITDYTNHFLPF